MSEQHRLMLPPHENTESTENWFDRVFWKAAQQRLHLRVGGMVVWDAGC